MRSLSSSSVIYCCCLFLVACSAGQENLLVQGTVSIEQEATVTSVNVFEKEGTTWVTGVLQVTPPTDKYVYGLLHTEVLDSKGRSQHQQDSCFTSFWNSGTRHTPGFYEMPQIQIALSMNPKKGSVIRLHPELFVERCKPK